jgi:hypothetical protein
MAGRCCWSVLSGILLPPQGEDDGEKTREIAGRQVRKVTMDGWHEVVHSPAAALAPAFVVCRSASAESTTETLHDSFTTEGQVHGA